MRAEGGEQSPRKCPLCQGVRAEGYTCPRCNDTGLITDPRDPKAVDAVLAEIDSAERETSSNGDNAFVRYVGPWMVAQYHRDPEDGDFLTPRTPDEYADALIASQRTSDLQAPPTG